MLLISVFMYFGTVHVQGCRARGGGVRGAMDRWGEECRGHWDVAPIYMVVMVTNAAGCLHHVIACFRVHGTL